MKILRTRIAATIAQQTLKNGVSKKYAVSIASFLLAERRTGELDSLLRDVQTDWAKAGHIEVMASSAHPLTAAVKDDISKWVQQYYPNTQKITITELHDPDIIGGVRISLPDQQLDLSVEAKLNTFKQLTTIGKA